MREIYKSDIISRALPLSEFTGIAVYFLLKDSEIVYIGISKNKYHRLVSHITEKRKVFNRAYFITDIKTIKEAAEIEKHYINKFKPIYNYTHNPNKPIIKIEPKTTKLQEEILDIKRGNKTVEITPKPEIKKPLPIEETKNEEVIKYEPSNYKLPLKYQYVKKGEYYHFRESGEECYKTKETRIQFKGLTYEFTKVFGEFTPITHSV